jgi:AcrR family transcriptional regulator
MTRPSQNADLRLIEAAQKMLKNTSLSQMNLRQVAANAGVNLGMFHYHFKSKDQFSRAVMQDVYERFFKNFNLRIEEADSSIEKLRQALLAIGVFVRDHRRLMLNMMRDVLDHNEVAISYVKANGQRHAIVLWDLVGRCQKEGVLEKMPRPQALAYLMPSVVGASLAVGGAESVAKTVFEKGFLKGADLLVLSDKALQKRIDMALKGLGAKERGGK